MDDSRGTSEHLLDFQEDYRSQADDGPGLYSNLQDLDAVPEQDQVAAKDPAVKTELVDSPDMSGDDNVVEVDTSLDAKIEDPAADGTQLTIAETATNTNEPLAFIPSHDSNLGVTSEQTTAAQDVVTTKSDQSDQADPKEGILQQVGRGVSSLFQPDEDTPRNDQILAIGLPESRYKTLMKYDVFGRFDRSQREYIRALAWNQLQVGNIEDAQVLISSLASNYAYNKVIDRVKDLGLDREEVISSEMYQQALVEGLLKYSTELSTTEQPSVPLMYDFGVHRPFAAAYNFMGIDAFPELVPDLTWQDKAAGGAMAVSAMAVMGEAMFGNVPYLTKIFPRVTGPSMAATGTFGGLEAAVIDPYAKKAIEAMPPEMKAWGNAAYMLVSMIGIGLAESAAEVAYKNIYRKWVSSPVGQTLDVFRVARAIKANGIAAALYTGDVANPAFMKPRLSLIKYAADQGLDDVSLGKLSQQEGIFLTAKNGNFLSPGRGIASADPVFDDPGIEGLRQEYRQMLRGIDDNGDPTDHVYIGMVKQLAEAMHVGAVNGDNQIFKVLQEQGLTLSPGEKLSNAQRVKITQAAETLKNMGEDSSLLDNILRYDGIPASVGDIDTGDIQRYIEADVKDASPIGADLARKVKAGIDKLAADPDSWSKELISKARNETANDLHRQLEAIHTRKSEPTALPGVEVSPELRRLYAEGERVVNNELVKSGKATTKFERDMRITRYVEERIPKLAGKMGYSSRAEASTREALQAQWDTLIAKEIDADTELDIQAEPEILKLYEEMRKERRTLAKASPSLEFYVDVAKQSTDFTYDKVMDESFNGYAIDRFGMNPAHNKSLNILVGRREERYNFQFETLVARETDPTVRPNVEIDPVVQRAFDEYKRGTGLENLPDTSLAPRDTRADIPDRPSQEVPGKTPKPSAPGWSKQKGKGGIPVDLRQVATEAVKNDIALANKYFTLGQTGGDLSTIEVLLPWGSGRVSLARSIAMAKPNIAGLKKVRPTTFHRGSVNTQSGLQTSLQTLIRNMANTPGLLLPNYTTSDKYVRIGQLFNIFEDPSGVTKVASYDRVADIQNRIDLLPLAERQAIVEQGLGRVKGVDIDFESPSDTLLQGRYRDGGSPALGTAGASDRTTALGDINEAYLAGELPPYMAKKYEAYKGYEAGAGRVSAPAPDEALEGLDRVSSNIVSALYARADLGDRAKSDLGGTKRDALYLVQEELKGDGLTYAADTLTTLRKQILYKEIGPKSRIDLDNGEVSVSELLVTEAVLDAAVKYPNNDSIQNAALYLTDGRYADAPPAVRAAIDVVATNNPNYDIDQFYWGIPEPRELSVGEAPELNRAGAASEDLQTRAQSMLGDELVFEYKQLQGRPRDPEQAATSLAKEEAQQAELTQWVDELEDVSDEGKGLLKQYVQTVIEDVDSAKQPNNPNAPLYTGQERLAKIREGILNYVPNKSGEMPLARQLVDKLYTLSPDEQAQMKSGDLALEQTVGRRDAAMRGLSTRDNQIIDALRQRITEMPADQQEQMNLELDRVITQFEGDPITREPAPAYEPYNPATVNDFIEYSNEDMQKAVEFVTQNLRTNEYFASAFSRWQNGNKTGIDPEYFEHLAAFDAFKSKVTEKVAPLTNSTKQEFNIDDNKMVKTILDTDLALVRDEGALSGTEFEQFAGLMRIAYSDWLNGTNLLPESLGQLQGARLRQFTEAYRATVFGKQFHDNPTPFAIANFESHVKGQYSDLLTNSSLVQSSGQMETLIAQLDMIKYEPVSGKIFVPPQLEKLGLIDLRPIVNERNANLWDDMMSPLLNLQIRERATQLADAAGLSLTPGQASQGRLPEDMNALQTSPNDVYDFASAAARRAKFQRPVNRRTIEAVRTELGLPSIAKTAGGNAESGGIDIINMSPEVVHTLYNMRKAASEGFGYSLNRLANTTDRVGGYAKLDGDSVFADNGGIAVDVLMARKHALDVACVDETLQYGKITASTLSAVKAFEFDIRSVEAMVNSANRMAIDMFPELMVKNVHNDQAANLARSLSGEMQQLHLLEAAAGINGTGKDAKKRFNTLLREYTKFVKSAVKAADIERKRIAQITARPNIMEVDMVSSHTTRTPYTGEDSAIRGSQERLDEGGSIDGMERSQRSLGQEVDAEAAGVDAAEIL